MSKRRGGPETASLMWTTLEDLQKRLSTLERVVDEKVPAYVAPMDAEVRKLIDRVNELDRRTVGSVRLGPQPYEVDYTHLGRIITTQMKKATC